MGVRRGDDRFIGGDPLRGLGALAVLLFHAGFYAGDATGKLSHGAFAIFDRLPLRLLESLNFGVFVFFALSGYLLGRPFVVAFIDGRPAPRVLPYLRNRALRLLPGVFVGFAVTVIIFGRAGTSWPRLLAVPLLSQQYFPSGFDPTVIHFWSLDVEAVFYLLLPLSIWLLARCARSWGPVGRRRLVLGFSGAVLVISLAASDTPSLVQVDRQRLFPMVAFAFTPGLALAALSTVVPARLAGQRIGRQIGPMLLAGAAVAFGYYVLSVEHPVLWIRNLAAVTASGLIVAGVLVRQWTDGGCWRALDNRALQWIGKRSYSLYVFHVVVLAWLYYHVESAGGPGAFVILSALAVPITIGVSALGYEVLERPFIARRAAWRDPGAPAPDPAEPASPAVASLAES